MPTTRKPLLLLIIFGLLLATVALRPVRRYDSHRFGQAAADRKLFRDGDLVFHTSRSEQSQAIQLATYSPWSHCGAAVPG